VTQLLWLADGAHLLSGSDDGQVLTWDTATQQGQTEFQDHTARVLALAELADHRHVLVDGDGSLLVGKPAAGGEGGPDETPPGFATVLSTLRPSLAAWSSEGRVLATSDKAGDLQIWQSKNGPASELVAQASPHSPEGAQAIAVAVSPDGKQIASGLGAKVLVWDAAGGGALIHTLEGHQRQVAALAYSPDGATLASGGWDGAVVLWDVKSGDKQRTLASSHKRDVAGLAWSPDGKRLASTGSLDNQVILWNPATGQVEATLKGTDNGVWGVAWSPNGKTLAVSTSLADILLWDVSKPTLSSAPDDVLRGHSNWVSALAWSPDGTKLASGGADRLVIVWDVPNRKRFQNLTGHEGVVRAVAFSPDGKELATSGLDQQVLVWPVEKGVDEPLRTFTGHTGPIDALAWLPDGSRLASASEDGTVMIWGFEQP
jgi:WD40 repeat protein